MGAGCDFMIPCSEASGTATTAASSGSAHVSTAQGVRMPNPRNCRTQDSKLRILLTNLSRDSSRHAKQINGIAGRQNLHTSTDAACTIASPP